MSSNAAFPERADDALSSQQAFRAMAVFLEDFWNRDGRPDDSLMKLLSWISSDVWTDGGSNDPAMWTDWLKAIDSSGLRASEGLGQR
jgi:hypothetical protein